MRNARNPFLLPALAATLCCMVVPLFKLALLEWGAPDPEVWKIDYGGYADGLLQQRM